MPRPTFNPITHGVRSGLEQTVKDSLEAKQIAYEYETVKIPYLIPQSLHKYTPDFILPNGIVVETKGRFLVDDRFKHLLVKEQHPDIDIRFVFSSASTKIATGAKTTVAQWCVKNGFEYAVKNIPQSWLEEPTNEVSKAAIERLRK